MAYAATITIAMGTNTVTQSGDALVLGRVVALTFTLTGSEDTFDAGAALRCTVKPKGKFTADPIATLTVTRTDDTNATASLALDEAPFVNLLKDHAERTIELALVDTSDDGTAFGTWTMDVTNSAYRNTDTPPADSSSTNNYTDAEIDALLAPNTPSDATPQALGVAAAGSASAYSRGDHVHGMPKLDDLTAPDDNTDLDATTSKHGLMPKTDKVKLDGVETAADVTDATNVAAAGAHMSGGTDVPVADGGTGASTPAAALTNLGAQAAANGAALPTGGSIVTGQLVRLTGQDATAKAGAGLYIHDGTGWICVECHAAYALGNLGAAPTLAAIPGCKYTAVQDQNITTAYAVTFSRPGVISLTVSGNFTVIGACTMAGRTAKQIGTTWTDNAGAALKLWVIEDDGTYIISSAGELT